MPRPRSKKEASSDHVQEAISQCSKALSKLGGRVRHTPRQLPADNLIQARQYLEGIINRLAVVENLISKGVMFVEIESSGRIPYPSDELRDVIVDKVLFQGRPEDHKPNLEEAREKLRKAGTDWEKRLWLETIKQPQDELEKSYDRERQPGC